MTLDASGNLGVGETSPAARLHLKSATEFQRFSGNATGVAMFQTWYNSANTRRAYFGFGSNNDSTFFVHNDEAGAIVFDTNNTERARIDASGNLGLGVTPSYPLHLRSAITNAGLPHISVENFSSATSLPQRLLQAWTGLYNSGVNGHNLFLSSNDNAGTWEFNFTKTWGGNLTFGASTDGTQITRHLTINSSGNVGIGTTSLASTNKLTVIGQNILLSSGTTTGISIMTTNNGGTFRMGREASDGSVFGLDNYCNFFYTENTNPLLFVMNGTERVRLTNGGELIVGVTDQGAFNLQCNGTGVWGAGAYVNGSDRSLKQNIQPLDSGLDTILSMRPVTFQYKPEYNKDQSIQPGFIAQELQEILSNKIYSEGVVQAGKNHLNVAYQSIIPILVKAIQELTAQVKELQSN